MNEKVIGEIRPKQVSVWKALHDLEAAISPLLHVLWKDERLRELYWNDIAKALKQAREVTED